MTKIRMMIGGLVWRTVACRFGQWKRCHENDETASVRRAPVALIGNLEPQFFSSSKKRALCCTSTQEEMRYEGSQGKAIPITRRRMTPPTPRQKFVHLL